jgi:glycosyltransferase involved in cell wall biosynthesis
VKIALCADGRSSHSQRWANGLADRGHDVTLVWASQELEGATLSDYRASISHHAYVRATPHRRPWMLPFAPLTARRLARRLKPDVVHGLFLSGHGWTAHALRVHPLVLSALGSDILDLRRDEAASFPSGAGVAYGVWRTRAAVEAADVVFADSVAIADAVRQRVPGTETRIIRFGVEISPPRATARSNWRRRLDIDDEAFVLLSSRLWRPNYNIDTIIRAFPAVRDRISKSVLVLKEHEQFSDLDYRRDCFDLVDELGVRDAVRTVGELDRDDLLELHAAADVYLSVPSRDGTAVSVLEAMVAGVAIVATEAPGIDPAILRNDETALLVQPRDPEALAKAIVDLSDSALRRRLVDRAGEVVRMYGDFDKELDRAVGIYEELLRTSAR